MKQIDFINESKHRIDDVLQAFKIGHDGISAASGPTVTLFEFKPNVGVRISKIVNLKNEFAISLGVQSVRVIAPTERGTIGIEVPNKERVVIPMSDMLYSEEYMNTDMALPLCMGRKVDCSVFMADLAEMPHLLVAGATGMGKSVGLNVIISSLINKKSPDELKLVLVDPKQVELTVYEKIAKPYLLKLSKDDNAIITDPDKALEMLEEVCDIMEDRYTKLKEKNVRNIKEYNDVCDDKMPYYVVIIDEYGDLIMQSNGSTMEKAICRIAQKARAVGIHMIISTQRPSTDIVTGRIKANFPTRISFRTVTGTDSRVILDRVGAEKLTGKGDMLYYNGGDTTRSQCAFISTEEVLDMCNDIEEEYADCEQVILKEPIVIESTSSVPMDTQRLAMKLIGLTEVDKESTIFNDVRKECIDELIALGVLSESEIREKGDNIYEAYDVLVNDVDSLTEIVGDSELDNIRQMWASRGFGYVVSRNKYGQIVVKNLVGTIISTY